MSFCCPSSSPSTAGALLLGGSATVYNGGDPYSGMFFVLPLDEEGDGTTGEYQDRTHHEFDGTGGGGSNTPDIDTGVGCFPSQHFDTTQFITLETDNADVTQEFSVSLWAKIDTQFKPRTFYSRGSFKLGYDFLNRLDAVVKYQLTELATGSSFCIGSTSLVKNQWYHLAASWEPSVGLKVFVNGVQNGSKAVSQSTLIPQADCQLSPFAEGAITGNLQEVRLHGSKRSAAWFLAEFNNLCDPDFYTIS